MIYKLNYNQEFNGFHNNIANDTLHEYREVIEIIAAQLNSLFGLISTIESPMSDILPVRSSERASKLLVLLYSISSLQFGSTILKLLINGQYPEAEALVRSLVETVSFAEYYFQNPNNSYKIVNEIDGLPKRKSVFRYLKTKGNYPKGGPRELFERYNLSAHGNIEKVVSHWVYVDEKTNASHIFLRRYKPDSFLKISKDIFIPLIGIQEVFRKAIIDEDKYTHEDSWRVYWELSHDREKIRSVFPSIVIGGDDNGA